MEQFFINLQNSSNIQQGVFLMCAGVSFVFTVQLVFYSIIKLWPKGKKAENI